MAAITVKQLHAELGKLIKQGQGNRKVALTQDDECNGVHECWFAPSIWREDEVGCLLLPFGMTAKMLADEYVVIG